MFFIVYLQQFPGAEMSEDPCYIKYVITLIGFRRYQMIHDWTLPNTHALYIFIIQLVYTFNKFAFICFLSHENYTLVSF